MKLLWCSGFFLEILISRRDLKMTLRTIKNKNVAVSDIDFAIKSILKPFVLTSPIRKRRS